MKKLSQYTLLLTLLQGTLMSATLKTITYNNTSIPVVFEQHNSLPIFNLQLVFKNSGSITDSKISGLTSITSKILNEGTSKLGAVEFARKLESKAISIDTSAGTETFVIEISCLKEEYQTALKYVNMILKDPNITKKTLSKLKTLQVSRLQQKENDFDYIAATQLKSLIYPNTPLGYSSSGTKESIESIELKDIKSKISSVFNLNNLIIVVGGDIKYSDFKNDIKDTLENFNTQKINKVKKIAFTSNSETKTIFKETEQSYIYFASPFDIDISSKDNHKAKVASFILGGSGFGSRLMEEIRVKHGLAYSAYGNISNKKSQSHFMGYLQTKLDNTKKAKKMVSSIVDDFIKNGVTQKELDAAKNFILGSEPLRTETFSQRLSRAFMLFYKGLPFDYPKTELDMINNLSLKDLNEFIKSHKEISQLTFSIVTKK